jgi:hypothetical protein
MNELFQDSSMIPNQNGVYLVLNLDGKPNFLEKGTGGYFKGKEPNVSENELQSNWVEDTIVVYIGKATDLQKRLRQYFRFGQGKDVGHYGGRYIWQLKNSKNLIVCWKALFDEDSRQVESDLIQEFAAEYGERPFANLVG